MQLLTAIAAKDSILVLDQQQFAIADVGKISGQPVIGRLLLSHLKPHTCGIVVPIRTVIDRDHVTLLAQATLKFDRIAKILRERRNATLARRISANASNSTLFTQFASQHWRTFSGKG